MTPNNNSRPRVRKSRRARARGCVYKLYSRVCVCVCVCGHLEREGDVTCDLARYAFPHASAGDCTRPHVPGYLFDMNHMIQTVSMLFTPRIDVAKITAVVYRMSRSPFSS